MSGEPAKPQRASGTRLTRVTRIALVLNAMAHGLGCVAMVSGLDPHAAGQPNMARRVAAAGFAALVMFGYVATQLPQSPSLIVLPIAFVLANLLDTSFELVASRDLSYLAPGAFEATFLAIYSVYGLGWLRTRRAGSPV